MNPKKYQIFVSSTYTDLAEERSSVMDSIQRMNHFPVGMEQFSADDDEQWEIIQETIQQTDYYICIIGHRYGSLGKDGLSYTEMEWDYAKSLGIPIMSFVRDRDTPTIPSERDSDPTQIDRLNLFIEKATAGKMVDFWYNQQDLCLKVVTALNKSFSRKPRLGWIRTESDRVAEEMAMLMEENRILRNDLEKMTSQISGTRPAFRVLFNENDSMSISLPQRESLNLTQVPYVAPIEWGAIPVELKSFITILEVEDYNKKIPTPSQIEEKIRKIHRIEIAQQTAIPIEISIENIGNAKAREVMVEIAFPKELIIMEKFKFEGLSIPELEIPANPLEIAKQKCENSKSKNPFNLFAPAYKFDTLTRHLEAISMPHSLHNLHHLKHSGYAMEEMGNKISIVIENLMHTKKMVFSDLVLIPVKASECCIEVSIICEEIPTPHKEVIIVTVCEDTK